MLKLLVTNCTQGLKLHFYWIWIQHTLFRISRSIWNIVRGIVKLEPIIIPVPQLNSLKDFLRFAISEIIISVRSALFVTLSWMGLYLNIPILIPILASLVILSYTARRWYSCSSPPHPLQAGLTQQGLRVIKMLSSCMCTIFCLLTFLIISLQSEAVSPSSFFSNLCSNKEDCPCVKDIMLSFTDLKEIGKVLTYHQARISRIFLFALESVALTDVASSAIRMSENMEFRIAMNYEGSLLFKHTSWIVLAAWVFNISNGMHESLIYEITLVLLVSVWILAALIDANYFNKENNVERTIDYSGFRYIKDIAWFQTDIDVVSMIISILLYSQLKTAPSIVYPDEIPLSQAVLPPRVHHIMIKLLAVITSEYNWELDSFRLESSSETERLEFTAEVILILFVCMSALRFKNNFKVCLNYMDRLRLVTWTPQMIPAEQRHDRRSYRRDLPFHWADNPDADMGDIQILGVAEVFGN